MVTMVHLAFKKAEQSWAEHAILNRMTRTFVSFWRMPKGGDRRKKFPGTEVSKPYKFARLMFPKKALAPDKNRPLWEPIFNQSVAHWNRCDFDRRVNCYRSTKELVMDYAEKEENLACARTCVAMDVWKGLVAVVIDM